MSRPVRAVRGATTVDADTEEQVTQRVQELVREMLKQNDLPEDDLVSVLFTGTPDITAMFPATAARGLGLDDVPVIGAAEMAVRGGTPRCIRVMMHVETDRGRSEVRHVYLHGAQGLRDRGGR